jgi:peptidoglycan-associated lipoprotein
MNYKMTSLALASALMLTAGCAHRPEELPPAPPTEMAPPTDQGGESDLGVGSTVVPGSRADFLQSVTSDKVFFATDSYTLDDAARRTLDAQAAWLNRNPAVQVTIEGHCDERGTREYNLALGDRRANAARDYLQSRGVAASRMRTISWGKERPVADGHDESAWAQNRRAVTVVPE